MLEEVKYFNAFNQVPEIGARTFKKILAGFNNDIEKAWQAIAGTRRASCLRKTGIQQAAAEKIIEQCQKIDPEREMEKVKKEGLRIMTINDAEYPKRLKEIFDPPAILYYKGELKPEDEFSVAVVGTRRLSFYGKQITPGLAADLSRAGLTIVSGLAKGIDTLAHKAALEAGGRTIAIVGSGLDGKSIYPWQNRKLVQEIAQNGAVLSEYALGTPALPQHFPARNRIVAGMCLAVLVIEAPEKSGALLTARHALEQNRDVLAVPGSIYEANCLGCNNLIKMGAKLVSSAQDVLDALELGAVVQKRQAQKILADTKEEALVLEYLGHKPLHIDKLIKLTELDIAALSSCLTLMEMKGKVKDLGGMNYVIGR